VSVLLVWSLDFNLIWLPLLSSVSGDAMMLEADVTSHSQNAADQRLTPVMARLPGSISDLTFSQWLALVKGHGKGIKLDFKTVNAVEVVLQKLEEIRDEVSCLLIIAFVGLEFMAHATFRILTVFANGLNTVLVYIYIPLNYFH
jgi:Uncharacterized conserved protein (DUF2181)